MKRKQKINEERWRKKLKGKQGYNSREDKEALRNTTEHLHPFGIKRGGIIASIGSL